MWTHSASMSATDLTGWATKLRTSLTEFEDLVRRLSCVLLAAFIASATLQVTVASAASVAMPVVKGTFGQTPKITYPTKTAPKSVESKVLQAGHGATVRKADLLVANYVGQIWDGKVFDSSFARQEPAAFPIGIGQVIPGWDKELVGQRVGSRVLLVLPPALGYGPMGNSQAGITGSESLVFVVDLLATYNKSAGGEPKAASLSSGKGGVTVSGRDGTSPKISITKGSTQPKTVSMTVLDRGNGAKVTQGLVVLQVDVIDWTAKVVQSTWQLGTPEGDAVGDKTQPSVLDALVGVHIGSRVLLLLPKSSQGGPYAVVIDIAAEPHGTKTQAS